MQQQAGRRARPPPLMLHWRTLPLPPSVVTWIQSSQGKDLNWWSLVKQQRCDGARVWGCNRRNGYGDGGKQAENPIISLRVRRTHTLGERDKVYRIPISYVTRVYARPTYGLRWMGLKWLPLLISPFLLEHETSD